MLSNTINTFLILLSLLLTVSHNGGQKLKNRENMHEINVRIVALTQRQCVNETF